MLSNNQIWFGNTLNFLHKLFIIIPARERPLSQNLPNLSMIKGLFLQHCFCQACNFVLMFAQNLSSLCRTSIDEFYHLFINLCCSLLRVYVMPIRVYRCIVLELLTHTIWNQYSIWKLSYFLKIIRSPTWNLKYIEISIPSQRKAPPKSSPPK